MPYKRKTKTHTVKKVPKSVMKYVKRAIQAPREKRYAQGSITNVPGFHNTVGDIFGELLSTIGTSASGGYNRRVGSNININALEMVFDFGSTASASLPAKARIIVTRQPFPQQLTSATIMSRLSNNNMLDRSGDPEIPNVHILHDKIYDLTLGSPSLVFSKIVKVHVKLHNRKIIYNDDLPGVLSGTPPNTCINVFIVPWAKNSEGTSTQVFYYNSQYRLLYNEA